jgi:cell division protein FtsB
MQLNQQIRVAETELDKTDAERERMEQRVALLSNSSLDLDMLEERARVMLNFAHSDDLVIFLSTQQKPGTAPKPAVNGSPSPKS